MRLLLVRHGNTFAHGDKVIWVGARTDLPLVDAGRAQASALGARLRGMNVRPNRIIAGPLRRTLHHARIIASEIGHAPEIEIDERLKEIDYGLWEGKTNDEVSAAFGHAVIDAWTQRAEWPRDADWKPDQSLLKQNIGTIARELSAAEAADRIVMLVSSNGLLRYFLDLVPVGRKPPPERARVRTGNASLLTFAAGAWSLRFWDMSPGDIVSI